MPASSSNEPTGHLPEPSGKKKRKARQHKRELYQKVREDLQVSGDLDTTPVGALKPEAVAPQTQADAPQCGLIELAIRRGWAVPEERKPGLVDELISIIDNPELPAKVKVAAFNALRMADQSQYERDHPELAGKARGGGGNSATVVGVTVQANIDTAKAIREMIERGELGVIEAEQISDKSSASGSG